MAKKGGARGRAPPHPSGFQTFIFISLTLLMFGVVAGMLTLAVLLTGGKSLPTPTPGPTSYGFRAMNFTIPVPGDQLAVSEDKAYLTIGSGSVGITVYPAIVGGGGFDNTSGVALPYVPQTGADNGFGIEISMTDPGDTLAARWNAGPVSDDGAIVDIYHRGGNGTWTRSNRILDLDHPGLDFGNGVVVSLSGGGKFAAAGAFNTSGSLMPIWSGIRNDSSPTSPTWAGRGISMSLNDTKALITSIVFSHDETYMIISTNRLDTSDSAMITFELDPISGNTTRRWNYTIAWNTNDACGYGVNPPGISNGGTYMYAWFACVNSSSYLHLFERGNGLSWSLASSVDLTPKYICWGPFLNVDFSSLAFVDHYGSVLRWTLDPGGNSVPPAWIESERWNMTTHGVDYPPDTCWSTTASLDTNMFVIAMNRVIVVFERYVIYGA